MLLSMDDLGAHSTKTNDKIFFAEIFGGFKLWTAGECTCMLDPELRGLRKGNLNRSANSIRAGKMADQNPTPWPAVREIWRGGNANLNNTKGGKGLMPGVHADVEKAACQLLVQNHAKNKNNNTCVGLQHGDPYEQQRYVLEGSNQVLRDKCNEILRRIWCEQQAHGLTNLCYFISETEKICFDALGMPCDQIYGWVDRGPKSFTHAWIKLGEHKQLIDITFYLEKSRAFPGGYWMTLSEYMETPFLRSMTDDTKFKRTNHWRYVYLCTLVEDRRNFLRCIFKYMMNELGARLPDIFKDAAATCWNCDSHLSASKPVICPDCASAVFCSEKCMKEERSRTPSHTEICDDYNKRERNNELTLKRPPVASIDVLLKGR